MPKKEEVYSSLFDLIFSTEKAKGGTSIEGINVSGLSGVGKGLAEMAAYPAIYPIEKIMDDINFQADLATKVKIEPTPGFKIEVGPFSVAKLIANPRGFIDAAFKTYEADKKKTRWTGGLKYLDGALLSVVAKSAGIKIGSSLDIGGAIHDATGYGPIHFGMTHPAEKAQITRGWSRDVSSRWDSQTGDAAGMGSEQRASSAPAYVRGVNAEIDLAVKKFERENGISLTNSEIKNIRKSLFRLVSDSGRDIDASERRMLLMSGLMGFSPRTGMSFSRGISDNFVRGIWGGGGDPDDMGYYTDIRRVKLDEDDKPEYKDDGSPKMIGDPDGTARVRFASSMSILRRLDDQISEMQTSGNFTRSQLLNARLVRQQLYRKINGLRGGIGERVGQYMYLGSWIKDDVLSGKIIGGILVGSIFDFKSNIWRSGGFDRFSEGFEMKINGAAVDVANGWFVGSDDTLGHLAESFYYWHPVNIVKGVFWDGRFWKKLGDIRGSRDLSISTMEFFAKNAPSQLLNKWKKEFFQKQIDKFGPKIAALLKGPLASFAGKYLQEFSLTQLMSMPLKELLTQTIRRIFTQIIASALPGIGNAAAFIADLGIGLVWSLGEKLLKPLLGVLVMFVLGAISLVLIGISGLGLWGRQTLAQPYLSEPVEFTSGHLIYGPIDYDFPAIDGRVNCNQNLPDQNIPGILSKTEFGLLADRWTAGTNFADECYNDVICRGLSKGVDPAFALLIWINESGASNYGVSTFPVQDFGINDGSTPAEDFNAQITSFMALSHNYTCPGLDYWTSWATRYLTGTCDATRVVNGITGPEYLDGIRERYTWVKPGGALPAKIKDSSRATGQLCVGAGGTSYPNSGGPSLPFGSSTLSGTPMEIWNKALAEFGISAGFQLVYPGSYWYDTAIGPGAWCFSGEGTVYCKADKVNGASSSMLTGLFRHEIVHQVQHSNGSFQNWPNYIHREWGAEHLSGNGGHYMFSTSSGYCMRGLQASQAMIDSGKCTKSQLDEIARGKSLAGTSCANQVRSFITGATIGSSCR